jgi:uncharacterized protein YceK
MKSATNFFIAIAVAFSISSCATTRSTAESGPGRAEAKYEKTWPSIGADNALILLAGAAVMYLVLVEYPNAINDNDN